MTYRGDWANSPTIERRRETRHKNGAYQRVRSSGRVNKSDAGWRRLRDKAEARTYANRSDAIGGN